MAMVFERVVGGSNNNNTGLFFPESVSVYIHTERTEGGGGKKRVIPLPPPFPYHKVCKLYSCLVFLPLSLFFHPVWSVFCTVTTIAFSFSSLGQEKTGKKSRYGDNFFHSESPSRYMPLSILSVGIYDFRQFWKRIFSASILVGNSGRMEEKATNA